MTKPLFDKVLIANRGEIALRIISTLRRMGIKSVAVYSEADTNSLHVQYADEAYFIGDSSAAESYLSIDSIISAIRASGAGAVHPGYGFLSENASFAAAIKAEGCTLIGPSVEAIQSMGDKIEAKKIAIEAGVSTVPGYMGIIKSVEQSISIAEEIGFPVIVKAAAGGGGRGMRVAQNAEEMKAAFEAASREAASHFSDGRVFIEKFIEKPRHIEIQLLADKYGNAICLGERECSIQRRHQKVIEEAPSPFIDEETRQEMYKQVASLAHKVGYHSAGTVEFIVDNDRNFYFLEMNTRLQVEHPVTELITGVDIVEEMVKIAAGLPLSINQEDVKLKGWAMECRIQAEDPLRGFLPSSGRVTEYVEPAKNSHIRIDSGVAAGAEVSMFYDSMIAKLCTFGENRQQAIEQMKHALGTFVIRGIAHNISFLEAVVANERFAIGDINTAFISDEYPDGFSGSNLTLEMTEVFMASALSIFLSEQKRILSISDQMVNQSSKIGTRWVVTIDNQTFPVVVKKVEDGYNIRYTNGRIYIRTNWELGNRLFTAIVNSRKVNVKVEHIATGYLLTHGGIAVKVYVRSPRMSELESVMISENDNGSAKEIVAPLTGQIISVKVSEGDQVRIGQELAILTAMKMENIILSEVGGKVSKIHVKDGDHVLSGSMLIELE
ncbi:MAG: acetyl/propionyl/methylcrotonyl-CoA carboxylase subunit alpha [Rickettsiaceae bacterium]|nr:acetyl/propionyl/methylcrotonyl-CoA carboxylase subunit alpha [Rickettsiaceae bacterium]